ncbi:MAG: hypothetical protein IT392_01000 [Nitrospirae bacterium]|nr:hypothetical protein [Nitrospirota bacterium]
MIKIRTQFSLTSAILIVFLLLFCSHKESSASEGMHFDQARKNGVLANEGFSRSNHYVKGWLKYADPKTGLIPRNLDWGIYTDPYRKGGLDIWNPQDSAADNYPFMVLTAALTDRQLFENQMLEILKTEIKLTSRVDRMPDTYVFSRQGFLTDKPNIDSIIFGSSEYIKDGLLPLTEWLGPSPWSDRMIGILDDMWENAPVDTPYGKIVSDNVEVNGEMLQTLSRIYWMTHDIKYLNWAIRLGDYYLLGNHHPTLDSSNLRLRDHGCEIISGLCELYATVSFAMPEKKKAYEKPIHTMIDTILELGRNEHGMFYNIINPKTGAHTKGLADTWGYTYNGFYTVYMIDKTEAYRQAVLKVLTSLNGNYRNYPWEGDSADGYADSIESALNLYNREPITSAADWIDSEIKVMWSMQKEDGVIEGWHCDGNFARTTIMYTLWKTQGVTIQPWQEDVYFGAVRDGDELYLSIQAKKAWSGRIIFDTPRHKMIMKLPIDWPRINQLPEWFVVDKEKRYVVTKSPSGKKRHFTGQQLHQGINVTLKAGESQYLHLKHISDREHSASKRDVGYLH